MSSRLSSSVIDKELASKINFREKVGKVDRVPDGLQVRSKVGVALVRVLLGVGTIDSKKKKKKTQANGVSKHIPADARGRMIRTSRSNYTPTPCRY